MSNFLKAFFNMPAKLERVLANQEKIMFALSDLQAGTDPAALTALKADIDAKTQTLAAAITQNTPAA